MKMKLFTGMLLGAMIGLAAIFAFNSCNKNEVSEGEYHCWKLTYTYYGEEVVAYGWETEAKLKEMIKELDAEEGMSGFSYKRASAKDEDACENLNYGGDDNGGENGGDDNGGDNGGGNGGDNGTSAPATPTGVSATANSSYVEVTWRSVSGADYYNIYRATSSTGSYSYLTYSYNTSCTDRNVSAGSTYYYKVTAVNDAGESGKSGYGYATIPSSGGNDGGDNGGSNGGDNGGNSDPVPSAPTGLTAVQAGPKAMAYVSLSWGYDYNADHYVVYRSTSEYSGYSKIGTTYASSYSDENNITNGKTYYYKVTAANRNNEESGYSNVASVTINTTIIEAPAIKSCKVQTAYNKITITWTYASGSGFSAPDEVRLISQDPTWTGLTDVFSWTSASSKTSHTVQNIDLIYNHNNKEEYTMYLQVRNSAGSGAGAKIVWNIMTNKGYIMGNLCGYVEF